MATGNTFVDERELGTRTEQSPGPKQKGAWKHTVYGVFGSVENGLISQ